jgi:hypothetical protein
MSRSERRNKLEAQLRALEQQFSIKLSASLRKCADGQWGMFGQNDRAIVSQVKSLGERLKSKTAEDLLDAGEEIERLRRELGFTESYPAYKRFLEYRKMQGSNTPGEPKLAAQFLEELGIERPR